MADAIETMGLARRFGALVTLKPLDLAVSTGELYGLLGPNGAGKSTTIKMLTTLLPPSEGTARVAGYDVVREPAKVRWHIGYVPQMLSADSDLTGYENLLLSAKLYLLSARQRRARILEMLEFVGLTGAAHRLVKTYSAGMIRRLEMAQAALHRPRVLFLDEPTIGLDPIARQRVWQLLFQLRADFGVTILLTTHDMEEANALCDEIALLHLGAIAVRGRPAEIKAALGPDATLADVFAHYGGGTTQEGGRYRDVA